MRKNDYYSNVALPMYTVENTALNATNYFCTFPRRILQVFIRKGFGERYFSLGFSIFSTIVLSLFPFAAVAILHKIGVRKASIMPGYLTWYIFLAGYLGVSIWHELKMTRSRSSFDFSLYSRCDGSVHPAIRKLKWRGKTVNIRQIECWIEPLIFFLPGLFLFLIGQYLGLLLMVCSYYYSLGYRCAYALGDNYVLNMIDEKIVNEEMEASYVDDLDAEDTRGFNPRTGKPQDYNLRRKLVTLMNEDDDADEVI